MMLVIQMTAGLAVNTAITCNYFIYFLTRYTRSTARKRASLARSHEIRNNENSLLRKLMARLSTGKPEKSWENECL